jgi:hypothetical protein
MISFGNYFGNRSNEIFAADVCPVVSVVYVENVTEVAYPNGVVTVIGKVPAAPDGTVQPMESGR